MEMEKLKVLEGAVQAIHHQLLSFDLLESKSQRLIQHLQIIRNLLPVRSLEDSPAKIETEKAQPAEEVQLGIQRYQVALSRIVRFFKAKVSKPIVNSCENESEFDLECLEQITSTINLIITNCSGMDENVLEVTENDDSASNYWVLPESLATLSLPYNVPSNSKKRTKDTEGEYSGGEINSVFNEDLPENEGTTKKKLKPKPPMEEALENDVVLLEIFHHSTAANLKNFRLVNRKWNETATSTLLIKNCLELVLDDFQDPREAISFDRFSGDRSTSSVSSSSQGEIPNRSFSHGSLTDLRCLLEGSSKFPTKSLTFKWFSHGLDSQLSHLLRTLGNEIKEVTFTDHSNLSISFLLELLLDIAPNLECLNIDDCILQLAAENARQFIIDQSGQCRYPVGSGVTGLISSLPNLKRLHFEQCNIITGFIPIPNPFDLLHLDVFKELFNAAVNLSSLQTKSADYLDVVLEAGRVQLIKELTYEPFIQKRPGFIADASAVEVYQKLANMKPKITKLCVTLNVLNLYQTDADHAQKKAIADSALHSILESSKSSLRSLKIETVEDFSSDVPVLPKVRQLILVFHYNDRASRGINPVFTTENPTFSFHNKFPHLHQLHLSLRSYSRSDMESYFPGELEKWVNPTVENLTIQGVDFNSERRGDSQFEGAEMLGKMFPNVTSVDVVNVGLYYPVGPILWHICSASVKRLSVTGLYVDVRKEDTSGAMNYVDSVFTGIPVEICTRLRNWPLRVGGEKYSMILDVVRTKGSICDLKNLEELNLSFNNFQSGHSYASHVTGLYAFDLMPQLKVTFTYKPDLRRLEKNYPLKSDKTPSEDMNSCLELIAPYVTQICNQKAYYY